MQVPRHQRDGLPCADQQRLTALQIAEDLSGQADRGERDGNRVLANGGVGTHGLCGAECRLEQAAKQRTDASGFPRHRVGRFHLAKNLRLTQYQRIEPRGDPHHVAYGLIVDMHIGARLEFFEAEAMIIGQPGQHCIRFDLILLQIKFAAITSRKDRRLTGRRNATQLAQGLDHLVGREGYALADVHRSGLVIDAKREESHAESLIDNRARDSPTSSDGEQPLPSIVGCDW